MVSAKAPAATQHLTVDTQYAGQRLDNFLIARLKGVPRTLIYRLLRQGQVRVNKGRRRPDYRMQAGDVVRIPPVRTGERPAVPPGRVEWLAGRILYEDDHLIALDKPSGLAVHGGSGVSLGVIESLRQLRPEARFLELVHRLDRDTSGCLLVAKRRSALLGLHAQLRDGHMDKRYLALVAGPWEGGARRIEAALEVRAGRAGERRVAVDPQGKAAVSRFTPKARFGDATLMEIRLLTGRTHQARVHAASSGHPIAGDEKYGDREFNRTLRALGLKRLFLHASRLSFVHPESGCKMQIEAPLPAELAALLDRLKHEAPL